MNTLRFALQLLPHPYPDASGADSEAWGELVISWHGNASQTTLLQTQWDLAAFAEWFTENCADLCRGTWTPDDLEWAAQPGESLAQTLDRGQQRVFSPGEENRELQWYAAIYAFREHHSLRFGLRGAAIPAIVIGCNHGGGEISRAGDAPWSYSFDMMDFLNDLGQQLRYIIKQWMASTPTPAAQERGAKILPGLDGVVQGCCEK